MNTICEKRLEGLVASAVEGSGLFYVVRAEPIPSKTTFDVTLKTYAPPHTEYIVTVTIPKNYPLSAPILYCKSDPKMKFGFLEKSQWKPCIGIREVLVEACHVVTRRDLAPRLPVLPPLRFQLHTKGPKSPKKDS